MMKNCHSNELYEDIKAQVTMRQVLERYGFEIRKHLCVCPFHNDTKPSMRVYDTSFYCFACEAGGDAVKFVALYLGVKNHEAAKIIAGDFGIRISEPIGYAVLKRREAEDRKKRQFKQWIKNAIEILCAYSREYTKKIEEYRPKNIDDEINYLFIYMLLEMDYINYLLDELSTDDMDALVRFYYRHSKEVDELGRWIGNTGFNAGDKAGAVGC